VNLQILIAIMVTAAIVTASYSGVAWLLHKAVGIPSPVSLKTAGVAWSISVAWGIFAVWYGLLSL
jgi:hypothetical protein